MWRDHGNDAIATQSQGIGTSHKRTAHTSPVTVSSPLLYPLKCRPEAVPGVFDAARLNQLFGRNRCRWQRHSVLHLCGDGGQSGFGTSDFATLR